MRVIGKKYPNMDAVLIFAKEVKEKRKQGKVNVALEPNIYKNDYRLMRQFATKKRECIFFFNKDDYIFISYGKPTLRKGNGHAKFIEEMLSPRFNPVEKEFKEHIGDIDYWYHQYNHNKSFVERIEFLFSYMETSTSLLYDIMKPRSIDIFMFKFLTVSTFLQYNDPMFFRQFKGNPNDRYEGIDPEFEARTLISHLKEFTEATIELEQIYVEVEESYMDEEFIDFNNYHHGENAPA